MAKSQWRVGSTWEVPQDGDDFGTTKPTEQDPRSVVSTFMVVNILLASLLLRGYSSIIFMV